MINLSTQILPVIVLFSHIVLLTGLFALIFRNSWGHGYTRWMGKYALSLGFFVASIAIAGSLFYSEVIGFEPCILCWWQRMAIYPLAILFLVAMFKKDRGVFSYTTPLALLAALLAIYHSYVYLGGASFLPCATLGGACSKAYIFAFGYITIPAMSLTVAFYILLIAWANKIYLSR